MNHSVYPADINKSAVACDWLNNTREAVAHCDGLPNLILCRLALLLEHAADRAYRSAASSDFDNAEGNLLTLQILKGFTAGSGCLRSGDENANIIGISHNAALNNILNKACNDLSGILGGNYIVPTGNSIVTTLWKHCGSFLVINLHNDKIKLITRLYLVHKLYIGIRRILVRCNISGDTSADVHRNFSGVNSNNRTFDLLVAR